MSNLRKEAGDKLFASDFNRGATFYSFDAGTDGTFILPNPDDYSLSLTIRAGLTRSLNGCRIIGNTMLKTSEQINHILIFENAGGGGFILDGYFHTWATLYSGGTTYAVRRVPRNDMINESAREEYTITGTAPANSAGQITYDFHEDVVYIGQGASLFKYSIDTTAKTLTYIETITLADSIISNSTGFCVSKNYIYYSKSSTEIVKANKSTGATITSFTFDTTANSLSYVNSSIVIEKRGRGGSGEEFLMTIDVD